MKVRNLKYYLGGFVILTMLLAGGVGYETKTTTEISIGEVIPLNSLVLNEKRTIQHNKFGVYWVSEVRSKL